MFDVAKAERCTVEVRRVVDLAEAVLLRNKQAVFGTVMAEDGLTLDEMAKHAQAGGQLMVDDVIEDGVHLHLSAKAADMLHNLLGKGITGPSFNHLKVLQPRGYGDAIIEALRQAGCSYDNAVEVSGVARSYFHEVVNG